MMATISNICFWFLLPRLLFLRLRRIHLLPPSVSSRSLAGKVYDTLFSHKYSYASCFYVYHRPGKSLTLENSDNYRNSKLRNLCFLIRNLATDSHIVHDTFGIFISIVFKLKCSLAMKLLAALLKREKRELLACEM